MSGKRSDDDNAYSYIEYIKSKNYTYVVNFIAVLQKKKCFSVILNQCNY